MTPHLPYFGQPPSELSKHLLNAYKQTSGKGKLVRNGSSNITQVKGSSKLVLEISLVIKECKELETAQTSIHRDLVKYLTVIQTHISKCFTNINLFNYYSNDLR